MVHLHERIFRFSTGCVYYVYFHDVMFMVILKFLPCLKHGRQTKTFFLFLQDILESIGEFVDGLKFYGGSHSLMPKDFVKEITDLAHRHDVYVSTGDWAEHLLRKGPSAFKHYVEVSSFLYISQCWVFNRPFQFDNGIASV